MGLGERLRCRSGGRPLGVGRTEWRRTLGASVRARFVYLLLVVTLLVAGAIPPIMRPWICDDAFITLRYVRNANAGLGLVYNAGEHVEGYTHFLWTILLWFFARLGIDPVVVGTWLPLPFHLATLWLLLRASRTLWPASEAAAFTLPVAAVLWAVHRDALVFASGGLETAAYGFFLLLGFFLLAAGGSSRTRDAAMAAYAGAALLRPEGLLHLGMALATLTRTGRRDFLRAGCIAALLVAPLYVWRLAYYHDILPNAFYAKSAAHARWGQGWFYVGLFGRYYAALGIAALAGMALVARSRAPRPLLLAAAHALVIVLTTAYVGGDFMFARFLLPATSFLALLAEHAVRQARTARTALATLLILATLAGGIWRERTMRWPKMPRGIVDEHSFYPLADVKARRAHGELIASCLGSSDAAFLVLGAQAMLAYYGRFPIAIEMHGLTDRTIARAPLPSRGRPGHERQPTMQYLFQRQVRFMILQPGTQPKKDFARIRFGDILGEIVTYDRRLMEQVRRCKEVEFVDFPAYLDEYLRRAPILSADALARDLATFKWYYFDLNDDPERLGRLQSLLQEKRGR